jgi:hypothetical protein
MKVDKDYIDFYIIEIILISILIFLIIFGINQC